MHGGSNSVPERPKWRIWTVCSYDIYRECVWSEIESARAKILTNMLPGSHWTLCRMRQCCSCWGEKVALEVKDQHPESTCIFQAV